MGTLNLSQEMPDKTQKELEQTDQPIWRNIENVVTISTVLPHIWCFQKKAYQFPPNHFVLGQASPGICIEYPQMVIRGTLQKKHSIFKDIVQKGGREVNLISKN